MLKLLQLFDFLSDTKERIFSRLYLRGEIYTYSILNWIRAGLILSFLLIAILALFIDFLFPNGELWQLSDSILVRFLGKVLIDIAPELSGIAIGVISIDYLNQKHQEYQNKLFLIMRMKSPHNDIADPAINELTFHGWHTDGSLNGRYLTGANLEGSDLSKCKLVSTNLSETNLVRSKLDHADLRWAILNSANLSEASLFAAKLRRSDLSEANLTNSKLQRANLEFADLSDANLSGADLSNTSFGGAKLQGADLSEANLCWAYLKAADMRKANLSGANLNGANLDGADLSEANLTDANLNCAILTNVNFSNADFTGSNVDCADPVEKRKKKLLSEVFLLSFKDEKTINDFLDYEIKARWSATALNSAILRQAKYDSNTQWPPNFDPNEAGCIKID